MEQTYERAQIAGGGDLLKDRDPNQHCQTPADSTKSPVTAALCCGFIIWCIRTKYQTICLGCYPKWEASLQSLQTLMCLDWQQFGRCRSVECALAVTATSQYTDITCNAGHNELWNSIHMR